jgi:hypothetical protein
MMNAAISMGADTERAGACPAFSDLFSDHVEPAGISFAKSFNERVGHSDLLQGKSSAEEATFALPGLKSVALAKKMDEVVGIPTEVKGRAIAAQEISAHGELESAVAKKIAQPLPTAVAISGGKMTVRGAGAKEVEPPALVEDATDDVSVAPSTSDAASVAGLKNDGLVPFVGMADEDPPLISNIGGPVVQKETDTAGKGKEIGSAKKPAKMQESTAMSKTAQKTNRTVVNTIAIEIKPAVGSSVEGAIPVVGQAITTGGVSQTEIGKTIKGSGEAVSAAVKPSTAVAPATTDGSVRMEAAHGPKATFTESEAAGIVADDQASSSKLGTSPEKIAAVAIPTGNQGDNKIPFASELVTGPVHLMSGGFGVSPGIASGVVVPGNMPGDLIATKVPVGGANVHSADLPTGSKEQDGPGLIVGSMGEMPRMLTATPTALEVGIPNGTHGWLKVRAEMADGGVINASVSAASSTGQEMLHRELPALTAYLQQEKVVVNTVVIHTTVAAGVESRDSGAGMNGGSGGQAPQKGTEGGEQGQNAGQVAWDRSDEAMGYQEVGEDGSLPHATYASGGSWLSVRA